MFSFVFEYKPSLDLVFLFFEFEFYDLFSLIVLIFFFKFFFFFEKIKIENIKNLRLFFILFCSGIIFYFLGGEGFFRDILLSSFCICILEV
jgi:hypothetical protein